MGLADLKNVKNKGPHINRDLVQSLGTVVPHVANGCNL